MEAKLCRKKLDKAVFISSRIRLARNFASQKFVNFETLENLQGILDNAGNAIQKLSKFKDGNIFLMSNLNKIQKDILFEKNLVSKDLIDSKKPSGVYISKDTTSSVMVNEEDHLRIQVLEKGFCLDKIWKKIDSIDNELEKILPYAFDIDYGYLTACPTNVGTGMRASVMMHLPALTLNGDMEKVVRGINQIGMVARGGHGEGSEGTGAFYQISNQQTLGVSEKDTLSKITRICEKLCEFEVNAREKLWEETDYKIIDKINRSWATLEACELINTSEATECLSYLRMAAIMGRMSKDDIIGIDILLERIMPGHLQQMKNKELESPDDRDLLRANFLKMALKGMLKPEFKKSKRR